MIERRVDHAIHAFHTGTQAAGVFQRAAVNSGTRRPQRRSGGIGARQAPHLVSSTQQLADDSGPHEARGSSDEYTHEHILLVERSAMLRTADIQVNLVVYQGISTNRIVMPTAKENPLGTFLRERRTHLDAAALGFEAKRRRTPGLRREEVAQRAHVSTTWYTWLEQGRGGPPSSEALDRIARALMLTELEREHVHMLALGRPPGTSYQGADSVTPRVQRVLDSLPYSPAMVRTATWDVVAWNAAAAAVLTDYGTLELHKRNILKLLFCDPRAKQMQQEWSSVSQFVVAAFRADVVRAGASEEVKALVEELCRQSADFEALWRNHDVRDYSDHVKRLRHPVLGEIALEHSQFAVDGRADLCLVVYNPVTQDDARRIRALVDSRQAAGSPKPA